MTSNATTLVHNVLQSALVKEITNPSNGAVIGELHCAQAQDVDAIIARADKAFASWRKVPARERARLLMQLAALFERDKEHLAYLEAIDNGKPVGFALMADMSNLIDTARYVAGLADKLEGRNVNVPGMQGQRAVASTSWQPLGVIAAIAASNAPNMYVGWKALPAIAAGNTVVYKPAEEASLSTLYIAKLFAEAGFPEGVFNVVPGEGRVIGDLLTLDPRVKKVSFTGGEQVGAHIAGLAARHAKPVTMELGGKAAQIITENADFERAIKIAALGFMANQGQICAAGTRILVPRQHVERVVEGIRAEVAAQNIGEATLAQTSYGPLGSAKAMQRVSAYVQQARKEGDQALIGGSRIERDGYFFEPTLFLCTPESTLVQEEVFGPVAAVLAYDSIDEAVQLANSSKYGLSSGVFTQNLDEALRICDALDVGNVWVNGFGLIDPCLPWGGIKASGYGRENGIDALKPMCYEKALTIQFN